ncbi:MAG TPA: dihydrofolate reductase, partial [Bacteroidia bacterium]|nr:dihydrofolate reductase [Bacteroidia bacterium]
MSFKLNHSLAMGILAAGLFSACNSSTPNESGQTTESTFKVSADRFADLEVLRYEVPGFNELSAQQKELAYYLTEAALCGRDIIWDQKYKHNLRIRKVLEAVFETSKADRKSDNWKKFETYAKRVFFSNGIHHHYSNLKIMPEFDQTYFAELVNGIDAAQLPLDEGQSVEQLIAMLNPILFDAKVDNKIVDLASGIDNVVASANNFYEGVTQQEVEAY